MFAADQYRTTTVVELVRLGADINAKDKVCLRALTLEALAWRCRCLAVRAGAHVVKFQQFDHGQRRGVYSTTTPLSTSPSSTA